MKTVNYNLSLYVNKIVKLTLEKNKEIPYVYGDIIAYLKYDNTLKMYLLNHPYMGKTNKCNSGEAAFDPVDITFITLANNDEKLIWFKEYKKFHNDWVNAKGYDYCELDVSINDILGNDELQLIMK